MASAISSREESNPLKISHNARAISWRPSGTTRVTCVVESGSSPYSTSTPADRYNPAPASPQIQSHRGTSRARKLTLRHRTRLHHISVGHAHKGKRVIMLVDDLDVRVLTEDGELLRRLTLDPSRDYQPQG